MKDVLVYTIFQNNKIVTIRWEDEFEMAWIALRS